MQRSGAVTALGCLGFLVLAGNAARADDPAAPSPTTTHLALTQLGVTVSVLPEAGFVQRVEAGRDVITAAAPFDHVTVSFAMLPGRRGEPCGLAEGVVGPVAPLELPPGWTHGARFRQNEVDTSVFCVDVSAGQLNAMIVGPTSDDPKAHLVHPWGTLFVVVRSEYGAALTAQEPVVVPPTPTPAPEAAPAPEPEPAPPPPPPPTVVTPPTEKKPPVHHWALGYRAYEGAFYDLSYGRELAPWASPDGKTSITLAGLRMFENRGLTINVVMLILSLGGAAGRPMTRVTTDASGNQWVNAAAEERAHAEYNQKLIEGAATKPFSLDIHAYHDSLGSQMDGLSMALLLSSSASESGVKQFGVEGGYIETNRNYTPAMDAPMAFSRGWFGITYDYRRRLYQQDRFVLGLHGHALLAIADPWMALVTIGPELAITDRLHITAYASQDLHRFDLSNGTGWRAELGVRF